MVEKLKPQGLHLQQDEHEQARMAWNRKRQQQDADIIVRQLQAKRNQALQQMLQNFGR